MFYKLTCIIERLGRANCLITLSVRIKPLPHEQVFLDKFSLDNFSLLVWKGNKDTCQGKIAKFPFPHEQGKPVK